MKILITGGCGFIGSNLVHHLLKHTNHHIVNIDKLTYASNINSLIDIADNPRYRFHQMDICDTNAISTLFETEKFDAVMHLAAESHVDRSIDSPDNFIHTNILGTYNLLEAARKNMKEGFRFHHISTDEVFGDLEKDDHAFTETTPYCPSSPYSASKASSDHLVRAWGRTYDLPVIITNCSNNYGPYQYAEKLIPLMISNALKGESLPVYGDGQQIRDWLYVEDHVEALMLVLEKGTIGETYNIGGECEMANIDVVKTICDILDELKPMDQSYHNLIQFVTDRPGHDRRYAIDISKIKSELGWSPSYNFKDGLHKTTEWYINHG